MQNNNHNHYQPQNTITQPQKYSFYQPPMGAVQHRHQLRNQLLTQTQASIVYNQNYQSPQELIQNGRRTKIICFTVIIENILLLLLAFVYRLYQKFYLIVMCYQGLQIIWFLVLLIRVKAQTPARLIRHTKISLMATSSVIITTCIITCILILAGEGWLKQFGAMAVLFYTQIVLLPRVIALGVVSCSHGYVCRSYSYR